MSLATPARELSTLSEEAWGRRKARLIAVGAAVFMALAIWLVAEQAFGIHLRAPEGFGASGDIDALNVALVTAVLSLAGWGLLALLERLTSHARTVWVAIAVPALLLSLLTPLSGTGVSAANRVVLVLMHVTVGAVLIPALYSTSPTGHARRGPGA